MNLELDDTQSAIKDSCDRLFERTAGAARARILRASGGADTELMSALADGGFLDLFHDEDNGPLTATLVVEWAAAACVLAPVGQRMLVAPALIPGEVPEIVAVADASSLDAVRYGAEAEMLIFIDGDTVRVARRGEFDATSVKSKFGYPMARVSNVRGEVLPAGSAAIARRWNRIAVAAETAGSARAALELTARYLGERSQFGKRLSEFQALQHRISMLHVLVDAARWTTREAAYHGAPEALAASAAINACEAGQSAFYETHQLTGAMGFTIEYDLHLWTMRLQALRQEMNGPRGHARALVAARWGAGATTEVHNARL